MHPRVEVPRSARRCEEADRREGVFSGTVREPDQSGRGRPKVTPRLRVRAAVVNLCPRGQAAVTRLQDKLKAVQDELHVTVTDLQDKLQAERVAHRTELVSSQADCATLRQVLTHVVALAVDPLHFATPLTPSSTFPPPTFTGAGTHPGEAGGSPAGDHIAAQDLARADGHFRSYQGRQQRRPLPTARPP